MKTRMVIRSQGSIEEVSYHETDAHHVASMLATTLAGRFAHLAAQALCMHVMDNDTGTFKVSDDCD